MRSLPPWLSSTILLFAGFYFMGRIVNLEGRVFGKLTVLSFSHKNKRHQRLWECQCDCGNKAFVNSSNLLIGKTRSCGCLPKKKPIHGFSKTPLSLVLKHLLHRCYNKNNYSYHNYGGRGISVCDEWRFNQASFYKWAIENGYNENLELDRINVNGNYEPSNCRWATIKEQARNRRTNVFVEYKGKRKIIIEWCEEYNMSYSNFYARQKRGWSIHEILTTPMLYGRKLKSLKKLHQCLI